MTHHTFAFNISQEEFPNLKLETIIQWKCKCILETHTYRRPNAANMCIPAWKQLLLFVGVFHFITTAWFNQNLQFMLAVFFEG